MTIRPTLVFLALTFAISWTLVIGGWNLFGASAAFPVLALSMLGPALAGLFCSLLFEPPGTRFAALGLGFRPNSWWLLAWLFPSLLAVASVVLTVLLSGHAYTDLREAIIAFGAEKGVPAAKLQATPPTPVLLALASVGGLFNAVALTFSEELGWRGYLHHALCPLGFWRRAVLTGAVWGLWHAPAITLFGLNYPGLGVIGAALFLPYCILLSLWLGLVREGGRSLWAAGILHGGLNTIGALTLLTVGNPPFPWNGIVGAGSFLALLLSLPILWLLRARLTTRRSPRPLGSGGESNQFSSAADRP